MLKSVSCQDINRQRFVRTTVHTKEREMNRTDEALIAATLPTYVNAFAQASRDTHYSTHTARTWTRKGRIDSDGTRPETHRNVSPWRRFESTVTLARITNVTRNSFNRLQASIASANNGKEMNAEKISQVIYFFLFKYSTSKNGTSKSGMDDA